MRIAIVTPVFPPYRGGIGTVAESDAQALRILGHEVEIFTPCSMKPLFRYGNAAFLPQLAWQLRKFDRVILHYPFFGGAEWAAIGAKKLILVYHMDTVGRGALGIFFLLYQKLIMPFILRAADRVVVTSFDYVKESAIKKTFAKQKEKFVVLAPSVDTGRFFPSREEKKGNVVLFVGGLDKAHYFKGVDVLLSAFARIDNPNAQLRIIGDGDLKNGYKKIASALGIADRVVFLGALSDEELPRAYRDADVFVFPSVDKSEAFGIVALEALASGVPVVASNLSGVRTIVKDGITGLLIPAKDIAILAEKIELLLTDALLREKMGEAGRIMIEAEYSEDSRAKKWENIL